MLYAPADGVHPVSGTERKKPINQIKADQIIITQTILNLQNKSQPHTKVISRTAHLSPAQPSPGQIVQTATPRPCKPPCPDQIQEKIHSKIINHLRSQNNSSHLMHNHPDRRQALAALASPAHARERSAGTFAVVLDRAALFTRKSVSFATDEVRD
jgi:hypothetical protein